MICKGDAEPWEMCHLWNLTPEDISEGTYEHNTSVFTSCDHPFNHMDFYEGTMVQLVGVNQRCTDEGFLGEWYGEERKTYEECRNTCVANIECSFFGHWAKEYNDHKDRKDYCRHWSECVGLSVINDEYNNRLYDVRQSSRLTKNHEEKTPITTHISSKKKMFYIIILVGMMIIMVVMFSFKCLTNNYNPEHEGLY
eukprot:UN33908